MKPEVQVQAQVAGNIVWLRKALKEKGVPIPPHLQEEEIEYVEAPELHLDEVPYWDAFMFLSSSRPRAGMDAVPLPIPWSEIDRYANRFRFEGDQFVALLNHLQALDSAYLEEVTKGR